MQIQLTKAIAKQINEWHPKLLITRNHNVISAHNPAWQRTLKVIDIHIQTANITIYSPYISPTRIDLTNPNSIDTLKTMIQKANKHCEESINILD